MLVQTARKPEYLEQNQDVKSDLRTLSTPSALREEYVGKVGKKLQEGRISQEEAASLKYGTVGEIDRVLEKLYGSKIASAPKTMELLYATRQELDKSAQFNPNLIKLDQPVDRSPGMTFTKRESAKEVKESKETKEAEVKVASPPAQESASAVKGPHRKEDYSQFASKSSLARFVLDRTIS